MRVSRYLAILLLGLVAAAPAHGTSATPDSLASALVPTWRLQVNPFGDTESTASLGAYHRLGSTWDVGLQLSGSLSRDHDRLANIGWTGEAVDSGHTDLRDFTLNGALDFRRWHAGGDRTSWFLGPRLEFGYNERKNVDATSIYYNGQWTVDNRDALSTGVLIVLGGDIRLLSRLTLTGALRPLGYSYTWRKVRTDHWTDNRPRQQIRTTGRVSNLEIDFTPAAYLTMRF